MRTLINEVFVYGARPDHVGKARIHIAILEKSHQLLLGDCIY